MSGKVDHVVIAGGGTAGWLAACTIAARSKRDVARPLRVTIVEAPDIPTIGVGEGTWPTMRGTLAAIGIDEAEFLVATDASFKQGSRFDGWRNGGDDDSYLHPFTAPVGDTPRAAVSAWTAKGGTFADAVSPQGSVCAADLAPRQKAMPGYAGALNYGYHLDAGKLVDLLKRHATQKLGVTHVPSRIDRVERADNGDIAALLLDGGDRLSGDLFIDCTGMRALLIRGEMGAGRIDRSDVLFNDRALAAQVPTAPDSAIASLTIGTAHDAGWIWDIALPIRRGIGCVYSSRFSSDDEALEILRAYVARAVPGAPAPAPDPRLLRFESGHLDRFWIGNCLAIGLSAGFVEPLEASAIVMIELSLRALMDAFPTDRAEMDIHARRFDRLFRYRWDRIVDFLKLHYVLSDRNGAYWDEHRATVPESLAELLALWQGQVPGNADFPMMDEIFPAASWQYVLYGMGGKAPQLPAMKTDPTEQVEQRARQLAAALPTNRTYLDTLRAKSAQATKPAGCPA